MLSILPEKRFRGAVVFTCAATGPGAGGENSLCDVFGGTKLKMPHQQKIPVSASSASQSWQGRVVFIIVYLFL